MRPPSSPGLRLLTEDPRPIGRAVPRSVVGHDFHVERRPDDQLLAHSVAIARRQPPFTLARLSRKPHRITPGPPYNPHSSRRHSHAVQFNRFYPHG